MKQISEEELEKIEEARVKLFKWLDTLDIDFGNKFQEYMVLSELVDITQPLWTIANRKREDV